MSDVFRRRAGGILPSLLLVLALLWAAGPAVEGALQQPQPAQEEFVPLDSLEAQEQLPATPLVMIAYAAAWLVIFGYVWSLWRRLSRVEREMADVARRIPAGEGGGGGAAGERGR